MKRSIITAILVVGCSSDASQLRVEHEASTGHDGELDQSALEPGGEVGSRCGMSATATIHATVRVDTRSPLNAKHDHGGVDHRQRMADHAHGGAGAPFAPLAEDCRAQCIREACGQVPAELIRLSSLAGGVEAIGPSYASQLQDLADWITVFQQECHEVMVAGGIREEHGGLRFGTWTIPNSERWPALTGLSVDGFCEPKAR